MRCGALHLWRCAGHRLPDRRRPAGLWRHQAAIGKNTGDDFRERKLTLPVIKAVAKANSEERAFWVRVIEKGDQRDGDLDRAMAILAAHGSIVYARDSALAWARRAKAALHNLTANNLRATLLELADFVVERVA
jgi:octaprenyl-diphosphate synthase